MRKPRRVNISKQECVLDDRPFKVDALLVSYEKPDQTMSPERRRLVFERGDSAAVLIFNRDTNCVVVVDQFRAPTLGKGHDGGWLTEAVAGRIEPHETPEATVMREAMEETGYNLRKLRHITTFFSSPGGTSERIFLYYAEVGRGDKTGPGGGVKDEDIEVREIPFDELLGQLTCRYIEDPKLIVAALWLQEELKRHARGSLGHSVVKYALTKYPDRFIGYQTGSIDNIKGVSIWVNSENEDMIMDRFIGRSISANIRYLGADKDDSENVVEDLVNDELTAAIGRRAPLRIGTVVETRPGAIGARGVDAILHVATVRGAGAGQGVKADLDDLARCTRKVLEKADERNGYWLRRILRKKNCESIIIPIMGAGDGGLSVGEVAPKLISTAISYLQETPATTLKEVYFLAFTAGHKSACVSELDRQSEKGVVTLVQDAKSVFISYAREDKSRLAPYIERLLDGLDDSVEIWLDVPGGIDPKFVKHQRVRAVPPGQDWQSQIKTTINKADCVLAFWSSRAVADPNRDVFQREIDLGRILRKCVQVAIEAPSGGWQIPAPFNHDQILDISALGQPEGDRNFDRAIDAVERLLFPS